MAEFGSSMPYFSISSSYEPNYVSMPNIHQTLSANSSATSLRRSPSSYDLATKTKTKSKSKVVKRSKSTPHLKAVIPTPSAGPDSPEDSAEKKRSRLGYHRTSVACGHCRKRKIRCQPAADPKGMCTMCVKLNKQCTYFPIEQPAVQDTKARPQENCDPEMTDSFVSSVSPHLKIEDLGQGHNFSQITAVPINMCREYGYDPENANVPSTAEGFPPLQHSVSWDSQTYRAFPAIAEDVPQDYAVQQEQWKTTDTLVNHNIHQHYSRPPIEYQQPNIVPATHNATPRNEMGWMGAAQRTTSMNGNEAAYANYHQNTANHSAPMHDNTRRSSTTSYPSSLSVAEHSSTPSSNDSIPPLIAAPASGTHGLPSQYAYNPHYHPYAIQHQQAIPESMQPLDGYGYQTTTAWYTDTNHHRY